MVKGFIGFRMYPRINARAWGAPAMPNSAKIRVIPPGRRARALGDDLGAVAGTSLDKGVELDVLAKLNLVKRSGRLLNGRGVSFCFIGGDLEKNTNFEGPLVDALRCFRA